MRVIRALLLLTLIPVSALALQVTPAHAVAESEETQFIALINVVRAGKGLVPLVPDGQLTSVARAWSAVMVQNGAISHNPNLATQITGWQVVGENVGVGPSVDWLENAFVNSPHHYANMVDPDYRLIGVGIVDTSDGQIWVTEDYKAPKGAVAVPSAPTPNTAITPTPAPVHHAPPPPRASSPAPSSGSAPTPAHGTTTGAVGAAPSSGSAAPALSSATTVPSLSSGTADPPKSNSKKSKKQKKTKGVEPGVLALAIGPSPHRMWSGYALGCLASLALGIAGSEVLWRRRRPARARRD